MTKNQYNFNEKATEWDGDQQKELPVWQSPKYLETKKKVIEMIESKKYDLSENDFWILMNRTSKKDKMAYTGLIISHNGCLKINDSLEENLKFKPSCVKENKEGYEDSLVYTYCNDEQGIYEVGELSKSNYKQTNGRYPYAMAYKRLFDRVVLKNSKLSYAGVYSDSEAEEFKEPIGEKEKFIEQAKIENKKIDEGQLQRIKFAIEKEIVKLEDIITYHKVKSLEELSFVQALETEEIIRKKEKKLNKEKEEVF